VNMFLFISVDVVIRTGVRTESTDIFMQEFIVVSTSFSGTHWPESCTKNSPHKLV
jgi:hypothetical protein